MNANSFYLSQIMINAWKIARAAALQFGGNARQYLAEALRQAWSNAKGDMWAKGAAVMRACLAANPPKRRYGLQSMQGAVHWIGR